MAMTWGSLTAPKGTSGSIATWVDYTLLDLPPIVDEAQALLYSILRCREMLADYTFAMPVGNGFVALPPRFLDPIGRMYLTSINRTVAHKDSNFVQRQMNYAETSGTLLANPFTTTTDSNTVAVTLANHGFSQNSSFNTTGATAFNGATINGTFPITGITGTNTFTIDISVLGTTPSGSGAGGGSSVAYICDNLTTGIPNWYGIWNESIYFDTAFNQACLGKLQFYQSLPILSATNQTNFLTNRYPQIMRTACVASAADFMKDDNEYQKGVTRLTAMAQQVSIENDMGWRGMELDTDTP